MPRRSSRTPAKPAAESKRVTRGRLQPPAQEEEPEETPPPRQSRSRSAKGRAVAAVAAIASPSTSPASSRSATPSPAPRSRKGKGSAQKGRGRGRARGKGAARGKGRGRGRRSSRKEESDEEEDDDDDLAEEMEEELLAGEDGSADTEERTSPAKSKKGRRAAPAKRGRRRKTGDASEDDDEEDWSPVEEKKVAARPQRSSRRSLRSPKAQEEEEEEAAEVGGSPRRRSSGRAAAKAASAFIVAQVAQEDGPEEAEKGSKEEEKEEEAAAGKRPIDDVEEEEEEAAGPAKKKQKKAEEEEEEEEMEAVDEAKKEGEAASKPEEEAKPKAADEQEDSKEEEEPMDEEGAAEPEAQAADELKDYVMVEKSEVPAADSDEVAQALPKEKKSEEPMSQDPPEKPHQPSEKPADHPDSSEKPAGQPDSAEKQAPSKQPEVAGKHPAPEKAEPAEKQAEKSEPSDIPSTEQPEAAEKQTATKQPAPAQETVSDQAAPAVEPSKQQDPAAQQASGEDCIPAGKHDPPATTEMQTDAKQPVPDEKPADQPANAETQNDASSQHKSSAAAQLTNGPSGCTPSNHSTPAAPDTKAADPLLHRTYIPNPDATPPTDPQRQFSVVSYNVLADCHAQRDYTFKGAWISAEHLSLEHRHKRIMEELKYLDADIICLQEVGPQHFELLERDLKAIGYEGLMIARTSDVYVEGEASFYRTSRFSLEKSQQLKLGEVLQEELARSGLEPPLVEALQPVVGTTPAVALLTQLKCRKTNAVLSVANLHVMWDRFERADLQCLQVAATLRALVALAGPGQPYMICGDFNAWPGSAVHQLTQDGYLSDASMAVLEGIREATLPDGSRNALVKLWWKGFQHTSSTLKSAYATVTGSDPVSSKFPHDGQCRAVDFQWYTSCQLSPLGVLAVPGREHLQSGVPNACFPSDHYSTKGLYAFRC